MLFLGDVKIVTLLNTLGGSFVKRTLIPKSGGGLLGGLEQKFKLSPSIHKGDYRIWKEQVKAALIMAKLAEGTRPSYQAHWQQWVLFRENQHKAPFLIGESTQARSADEDALLDFVVFFCGFS